MGLRAQNGILAVQPLRNELVWCVYCQSDPALTLASHTRIFSLVAITRNTFEICFNPNQALMQWNQMQSCEGHLRDKRLFIEKY